ncbi:restriction endonuclease, partial [Vibrio anguillarum]|nr:restriction endonuclease [Vibrio anguillarum]
MRLGYEYLSLKGTHWDKDTNIFSELFSSAVSRINPDMTPDDVARLLEEVKLS